MSLPLYKIKEDLLLIYFVDRYMLLYLKILIVFVTTVSFYVFYYLIFPKFRKTLLVFDSNNIIFLSWLFTTVLLSTIVTLKHYAGNNSTLLFKILIQTIVFSIIPTFNFVVKPYLFTVFNKKWRDLNLEKILPNEDKNTRVYTSEVANAFALGIAGFGKIIIVGNELINSMNKINLKGILFHELAHHKYKHVKKVYLLTFIVSFLISSVLVLTQYYFRQYVHISIIVALNGALYGLLIYYSMGFQKKMEFEADKFAASEIGINEYISTLYRLNNIKNGSLEGKSLTHPTLTERVEYLNEINERL